MGFKKAPMELENIGMRKINLVLMANLLKCNDPVYIIFLGQRLTDQNITDSLAILTRFISLI